MVVKNGADHFQFGWVRVAEFTNKDITALSFFAFAAQNDTQKRKKNCMHISY